MNKSPSLWADESKMKQRLLEMVGQAKAEIVLGLLGWDTFLSGGLVLQTMLGERWTTDIDIYTTNDNFARFECLGPFTEAEANKDEFGYSGLCGVKKVLTSVCGEGCKIDMILVTSMVDIFKSFDFDFCKCWYDGEGFQAEHPDSILTKSCVTRRVHSQLQNYPQRRQKYEERGFTIIDLGDDLSPTTVHDALLEGTEMSIDWLELDSASTTDEDNT